MEEQNSLIQKREPFYFVENKLITSFKKTLTWRGIVVYNVLCLHLNNRQKGCWPGWERLKELTRLSEPTIRKGMKELEDHNILKITERFNKKTGAQLSNLYVILTSDKWKEPAKKKEGGVIADKTTGHSTIDPGSSETRTNNNNINNNKLTISIPSEYKATWLPYKDKYGVYNFYRKDNAGYVLLSKKNPPRQGKKDMCSEHKWVYQNFYGETPAKGMHINHINHKRDDNRPENLECLTASEHISKHHKEGLYPKLTGKVGEYGNQDINLLLQTFKETMGYTSKGRKQQDRWRAKNLLNEFTIEQLKVMLEYCASEEYAPRIGSVEDLWYKRGQVLAGLKTTAIKQDKNSIAVIS